MRTEIVEFALLVGLERLGGLLGVLVDVVLWRGAEARGALLLLSFIFCITHEMPWFG
mgnify:CR=1 FL=1